jgi:hypothetical protein
MNIILKSLLAGLVFSAGTQLAAHAAVLTSYDFPGVGVAAGPQDPTVSNSAIATGTFGLGSGLEAQNNTFFSGYQAQYTSEPGSLSAAETAGDYFSFTITPSSGTTLNLTDFDLSATNLYTSSDAGTYALESSVGGFGSGVTLDTYSATTVGSDVTLGSAYDDLSGPVEFRLYIYGAGAYQILALQNESENVGLQIDGSAATPEPGTYALAALGLIALVAMLRSRRPVRL